MWQRQLGEHAPEILSKLNAVLGGSYVDRLQFVIDPERLPDTEQSISHADVDVSQLPQATAFAAERIVDPDLRLQFLRAAAASQASDLRTR
jgi:hypothetical protein